MRSWPDGSTRLSAVILAMNSSVAQALETLLSLASAPEVALNMLMPSRLLKIIRKAIVAVILLSSMTESRRQRMQVMINAC